MTCCKCLRCAYLVLLLCVISSKFGLVDAATSFTIGGEEYNCYENIICLGDAHIYSGNHPQPLPAKLSLTHDDSLEPEKSAGIAYYNEPIRLLDPSTRRPASFNTSFHFYEVPQMYNGRTRFGDGMAFVLSANNSRVGVGAEHLGFFGEDWGTSFKSIAVEFDNFYNNWAPLDDISWRHVSLDFQNITAVVARNTSEVDIDMSHELVYAWVEYSAEMQKLEVRINHSKNRPSSPFISHPVNLSDVVEEFMWVGFTAGNGGCNSTYYVGRWTFESYGILAKASEPPAANYKEKKSLGKVVGYSVGVSAVVLALVLVSALSFLRRRGPIGGSVFRSLWWGVSRSSYKSYGDHLDLKQIGMEEGYRFSYEELSAATGRFSEDAKLGEGGFGSVYRGVLPISNLAVAVKKVTRESEQGEKEFKAEVSIISQLRHRNLIRLLGWCIEEGKYYIVYDLMPNGSLDKVLFDPEHDNRTVLSWAQRYNIIRGTAVALDYLHQGWNQQVIHRDIKSSNILLDERWNAKLGDFGLARLADHQETPSTTIVAGTLGYIAPEAIITGKFNEKTDVFAFGAVALEIACGRRSLALHLEPDETVLVDWVWQHFSKGDLLSVVDKRLAEYDKGPMEALLLLGLLCSHPDPSARPPMRNVVQMLFGDAPLPFVPATKPCPIYTNWILNTDGHVKPAEGIGIHQIERVNFKLATF